MSTKIVLKLNLDCEKCKRRAMRTVAGVSGVDSVQIDSKDNKMTVIGNADPVEVAEKLRKYGSSDIVSVGPAKEEKKDDKKKDEPKKDEPKKDSSNPTPNIRYVYVDPYGGYNYSLSDENPNACAIS